MPKIHVLRNPWETTWARCGCMAPHGHIVPADQAEEATCLVCRASAGLLKSVRQVELPPDRIIPSTLGDRIQAYTFSNRGWESVRNYGRQSDRHHWHILDVRPPLCSMPNYQSPDDIWGHDPERSPAGHPVVILHREGWYGALRSYGDLLGGFGVPKPPGTAETASEGPLRASKTWLERVAGPPVL